jgi:transposase
MPTGAPAEDDQMIGKQIRLETDFRDDQWAFVAAPLSLMTAAAPQRRHDLREVSNALRWIVRAGGT